MTVKQWQALQLPVMWDIYYETEVKSPQEFEVGKQYRVSDMICEFCGTKGLTCECYQNQSLNLDAPVPDGIYRVREAHNFTGLETGITVKDGKFVPETTAECLYKLMLHKYFDVVHLSLAPEYDEKIAAKHGYGIDHVFVQRLEWIADDEIFEVYMGS